MEEDDLVKRYNLDVSVLGDLVQRYKLNVSVLGDRNREILHAPSNGQSQEHETVTKIWQQKRALAHHVYLEESQFGELRAIKQVHWRDVKRDLRELQVMGRVTEENAFFVQFLGWFSTPDYISFAMEYCPLGDVSQCFQDPVPEMMARNICGQLLEGLGKLHEMGITHRDIKPQNVLVVQKDPIWVKIGDFGISKSVMEGEIKTDLRTRAGTDGYIAPEVLQLLDDDKEDSSYTCAVDIWSLGCFLYYVLTKTTPFTDVMLRDYCLGRIEFPEILLTDRGVSRSGRHFIKKLMALHPQERPQASKDLVSDWEITEENQTSETDSLQGTSREVIKLGKRPEYVTDQPSTSININGNAPLYIQPQSNNANIDDEMNYQSSELWLMMKDTNTDIGRIRSLLESGANPNKLRDGHTALHNAAERGSTTGMELLITYGANVQLKTIPHEETALHLATYDGDISKLRLLLKQQADVDAQNADGDTTLHLAILRFHTTEAMELLLSNGASTEIKGRNGYTPLQYAISLDLEEKARVLLDNNTSPNVQDERGRTPLHQSILSDKITLSFIKRLVEAGANIDQKDKNKRSPLYEAAKCNNRDIIHYLIESGANREIGSSGLERRLQWMQFWRKLPWPFGK